MGPLYHKRKVKSDTLLFEKTTYLPRKTASVLEDLSLERGLPISRLIQFAVDNELDQPIPFNYPVEMPEREYIEGAYIEEAKLILEFLRKFTKGIGRDVLMICRREIGIPDRHVFMEGYRELLASGQVEEVVPPSTVKFKNFHEDYRYVQIKATKLPKVKKDGKVQVETDDAVGAD